MTKQPKPTYPEKSFEPSSAFNKQIHNVTAGQQDVNKKMELTDKNLLHEQERRFQLEAELKKTQKKMEEDVLRQKLEKEAFEEVEKERMQKFEAELRKKKR